MVLEKVFGLRRRNGCLTHQCFCIIFNISSYVATLFDFDYTPNINSPLELGVLLSANVVGAYGLYKRKPLYIIPQMCLMLNQILFAPTWIVMKAERLLNYLQIDLEMDDLSSQCLSFLVTLFAGATIMLNAYALIALAVTYVFDNYAENVENHENELP